MSTLTPTDIDIDTLLNPKTSPSVRDPDFPATIEISPEVPSAQTTDPHRLTLYVPTPDATVVSLGKGASDRIPETGITGKTNTHIHWETVSDPARTLVMLGGPMLADGPGGDGAVAKESKGYAMMTAGHGWHCADLQQRFIARGGDIVLRTTSAMGANGAKPTAQIQSDQGNVEVIAKTTIGIGSQGDVLIVGDPALTTDATGYGQPVGTHVMDKTTTTTQKRILNVLDMVTACYSLYMTTTRSWITKVRPGTPGWQKEFSFETFKDIGDIAKIVSQIVRFADDIKKPKGRVSIVASKYASMNAQIGATMYGAVSSTVASFLSASVLGGTAGIKGLLHASMWASLYTGVKSARELSLESEWGTAAFRGYKRAEVSSMKGEVRVQAQQDARINSVDGNVYVHSPNLAYIGATNTVPGAGYGLLIKPGSAQLGQIITNGATFTNSVANFGRQSLIDMDAKGLYAMTPHSSLVLSARRPAAMLDAGRSSVELSAVNITVSCPGRVLLQ
ncbi:uncharacterized protein SOCE26_058130 [Sorangium cellulosum]|uniref:Uncharacterized protein n=1 Tax=Sorangium cellulosum TaxID=56 RepID=A0A2L0EYM9_SORCE|nr:hypothetical protein [Sorangium cellulosum]AUX44349.1 uncharacterized protein SOCE26_058130 [Sorangium cellulosum]